METDIIKICITAQVRNWWGKIRDNFKARSKYFVERKKTHVLGGLDAKKSPSFFHLMVASFAARPSSEQWRKAGEFAVMYVDSGSVENLMSTNAEASAKSR